MTQRHVLRPEMRTVCRFSERAAAPEGGAIDLKWQWIRGCLFLPLVFTSPVAAQSPTVPSGQHLTLNEVLVDVVSGEDWLRFRFVAPDIARDGGTVTYASAEGDFVHLCYEVARPYLVEYDLAPDVIVISLMDRPIEFGTSNPDATQFFEAFRIVDDACVPDTF